METTPEALLESFAVDRSGVDWCYVFDEHVGSRLVLVTKLQEYRSTNACDRVQVVATVAAKYKWYYFVGASVYGLFLNK